MAIGMLSLATLIPVGKALLARGAHADRSSACGTAAWGEIGLRGIDRPEMWRPRDLGGTGVAISPGFPLVIDPLFLSFAGNVTDPNADFFPYPHPDGLEPFPNPVTPFPAPPTGDRIRRVTINSTHANLPLLVPGAMAFRLAERVFTLEDDAEFAPPEGDARTRRAYSAGPDGVWGYPGVDDDGNGAVDDASEAGMAGLYLVDDDGNGLIDDPLEMGDDVPQFAGKYSWIVTIVPALSEITPLVAPVDRKLYTASVVVIHNRTLIPPAAGQANPPHERIAWCEIPATSTSNFGGGDVRLRFNDAGEEFLKLSVNQWIMVAGQYLEAGSGTTVQVHRWYRIAGLGDPKNDTGNDNADYRDVTLAGPDIIAPTGMTIDDLNGLPDTQWLAYIIDGAVGVFEKTIEIDQPSLWTH